MVRSKGSKFEYEEERDKDLMNVFYKVVATAQCASIDEVLQRVVTSPSRRFWVSEDRATLIVKKMLKGRNPHIVFVNKRKMYGEILLRVTEYRDTHPNTSIQDAVWKVIRKPAPQFYITPGSAAVFICNARKREEKNKNKLKLKLTNMFKKDRVTEMLQEYIKGKPSKAHSVRANECSLRGAEE